MYDPTLTDEEIEAAAEAHKAAEGWLYENCFFRERNSEGEEMVRQEGLCVGRFEGGLYYARLDRERHAVRSTPRAACLAMLDYEARRLVERLADVRRLREILGK